MTASKLAASQLLKNIALAQQRTNARLRSSGSSSGNQALNNEEFRRISVLEQQLSQQNQQLQAQSAGHHHLNLYNEVGAALGFLCEDKNGKFRSVQQTHAYAHPHRDVLKPPGYRI